jgi:pentatricopeptide repeat protein
MQPEREMTKNERALVDTCFEEGQYEAGIMTLDQLRSAHFKPST